ncbi:MAG: hypothetical protein Q8J88_03170 [Bacteroidales bacterium]|nr:hypothetical protein [Bacteroidales bacterium]
MKRNKLLKILVGIVAFFLLLILIAVIFIEPWTVKKIESAFNKNADKFHMEIENVKISLIKSGITLNNVTIVSKLQNDSLTNLKAEIAAIEFKGIKLFKAMFKNDVEVREVNIFNSHVAGKFPFKGKAGPAKVSPLNIRIKNLVFDRLVIDIKDEVTSQAFWLYDAFINVYDLQLAKLDTISKDIFKQLDFNAQQYRTVTSDSMYTIKSVGINYSATSNFLVVDSFSVQPNYSNYEFTARHQFEIDRIEAGLSQISFREFSATEYIKSGNLISSYIEIGKFEMSVFRDKRKEFNHVNKPAFQEILYNYPGKIGIDSIGILDGGITYTEHAEKANEPGIITFDRFNALIFNILNDTIYKTKKAYIGFNAEAFLMDKAKLTVQMKSRLFDSQNTFAVNGKLLGIEAMELNPILEKNAFIYATSGKIEAMNFSFTANNTKSSGQMKLLYEGLNVAVKNKMTDDTTAVKERVISVIANMLIMHSNPMPDEEARQGVIVFERNPEKSFFSYCAKSLFSGIKSSVIKSPDTPRKSSLQKKDNP